MQNPNILVVDDERNILRVVATTLKTEQSHETLEGVLEVLGFLPGTDQAGRAEVLLTPASACRSSWAGSRTRSAPS